MVVAMPFVLSRLVIIIVTSSSNCACTANARNTKRPTWHGAQVGRRGARLYGSVGLPR